MFNTKKSYLNQISDKFKLPKQISVLENFFMPVGKQIHLIRTALGITQAKLASKLGYESNVPVAKIESGDNKNPTIETLKNYASALGCELLIGFVPKKEIKKVVEERAEKKAREIVNLSVKSSALELQKPGNESIKEEIEELKKEIIEKKRKILWDD